MLVEFFFGLVIFGIVSAACYPLGVVALGIGAFAVLCYWTIYKAVINHQEDHQYDGQAKFDAKQRREMADFMVVNSVEQPWNVKGRIGEWQETPSQWRPSGEELQSAIERNRGRKARTYTYDLETGKWSRK